MFRPKSSNIAKINKKKTLGRNIDLSLDEDEKEEKKEFGSNDKLFQIVQQDDFNLSISDRSSVQND